VLGDTPILCSSEQWGVFKCQEGNHERGVGYDEVGSNRSLLRKGSGSHANSQLLVI
jgi:hypothetical protein